MLLVNSSMQLVDEKHMYCALNRNSAEGKLR